MNQFIELRKLFFDFFKEREHAIVKSSSLIPDDPSVLLTTAGMQQFKKYYTGELNAQKDFNSSRAASIQKCFRTSDIEEVGDKTHLTFFEMLGNFSFGPVGDDNPEITSNVGYFKKSAIVFAYEFITNILQINQERIFVTIFEGDNEIPEDLESYRVWNKEIGLEKERIFKGGKSDNFWGPTGNEGPCGPTTEIYLAENLDEARKMNGVEIWNIVFNEYYGKSDENGNKKYRKVAHPGIDTGMGFERLLTILEEKDNVFETSSFSEIVLEIKKGSNEISQRDIRILSDHIRGAIFLIADGINPSNKEVGYVLRRIMRKIIGIFAKNNIDQTTFERIYEIIKKQYGKIYSEICEEEKIMSVWNDEFSKFQDVISKGVKEISKLKNITGKEAFYIYETFGLPFDLIKEVLSEEASRKILFEDFEKEMEKHQEISRAGVAKKFGGHGLVYDSGEIKAADEKELSKVIRLHTTTHLLQWALRKVLGNSVKQMGSDITSERLRFDFSFDRKVEKDELEQVENLVNEQVEKDLPVFFEEMSKEKAIEEGAMAFFREKYPEMVRVYSVGSKESGIVSKEICGGPHVKSTKEIGKFKILKEEAVGKGIRRIRANVE